MLKNARTVACLIFLIGNVYADNDRLSGGVKTENNSVITNISDNSVNINKNSTNINHVYATHTHKRCNAFKTVSLAFGFTALACLIFKLWRK